MAIDMGKHFTGWELVRYSLPSIAMMIFTSIYGIVDGVFVSNYAGKSAFAAVNLIMPYIMVLSVAGFMIGTGGSAIIAKTRGEGDDARANEYFSLLVYFGFALGLVLAVFGWFTLQPVAEFLGATGDLVGLCVTYGRIIMLSLPFFTLQYVFQVLFVTAGKPTLGFIVIVAAGISNIILDAVFVAMLGWGVEGAGLATVVGEVIGGGAPLLYFFRKNSSYLRLGRTVLRWRIVGKACVNGSSEMVANISISLVSMVYNFQLMRLLGEDGVAAYGVIMYTAMIFLAVFSGYNMGMSPLLSYQYGAQNHREMRSILMKSLRIITVFGVAMFAAGQLLAAPFSWIFTGYDQQLYEVTVHGYRIFALCYLFMGFSVYGSAFFTALNNGVVSALLSFLRTMIFETSSVIILPIFFGVNGIWSSVTVAEILGAIATAFFMIWLADRYGYSKKAIEKSSRT